MKNVILIILLNICSNYSFAQKSNVEKSGDILQIVLPFAAFSSTLIWKDGQKGTLQFIKTMGTSIIITHGLKVLINKPRPNGGNYSFPSGHTSSAFTGTAFLQKRYGWRIGIPMSLLAGYIGWTRVYAYKHDYWDVLGGAAIGIGSAYLFTKPYKKEGMQIFFGKSNGNYILRLNYIF